MSKVNRRPADVFVATFLGEANLLPVEGGRVRAFGRPAAAAMADPVAVVRPEDLEIVEADSAGAVRAKILSEIFQGTRCRLSLRVSASRQAFSSPSFRSDSRRRSRTRSVRARTD